MFSCGRNVLDRSIHSGGFCGTKEEALEHFILPAFHVNLEEQSLGEKAPTANSSNQNFAFLYGCKPGSEVKSSTNTVQTFVEQLLSQQEKLTYTTTFPKFLDAMKVTDFQF